MTQSAPARCSECHGAGSYYTEWSDSADRAVKSGSLKVVVLDYPEPPDGTVCIQCPKCKGGSA